MNNKCCENKICETILMSLIVLILIIALIIFIIPNNEQQKSILTAIAKSGDNTQVGTTTIKFSTNEIVEGNALSHVEGSDEIQINETGIYQISYQLFGQESSTNSFNFNAVLLVNNTSLDNTFNEGPVLKDITNNRMTLTSTVILKLNAGDILKLQAVSIEDIEYPRARIDIEQIKK